MAKIVYGKKLADVFPQGFFIDQFWTNYDWYSSSAGVALNTILFLRHSAKVISNSVIDALNSEWVCNINKTPAFTPEPGMWQNVRFINSAVQMIYGEQWNRLYNEYVKMPVIDRDVSDNYNYNDTKTVDLTKTNTETNQKTGTNKTVDTLNNTTDYSPTVIKSTWGVNSGSAVNQEQNKTTSQAKDTANRNVTETPNITDTINSALTDSGTVQNNGIHTHIKSYQDKPQFELIRDFFISQDYTFYDRIIDDIADYLFIKIYDVEEYL